MSASSGIAGPVGAPGAGGQAEHLRVEPARWLASAQELRSQGHDLFDWLGASDETDDRDGHGAGLEVVCHVVRSASPAHSTALRTRVPDGTALASLTPVWRGAAWHEREAHEMLGLQLTGFDDGSGLGLRPLLLPDGFEGTPLRKSFVLAARVSRDWPGARDPGEAVARPGRRRVVPPGVPDASWGPR